jgi:hypothetical protein
LAWQAATGCRRRALVESTMDRYKPLIGTRLRARDLPAQRTEAAIGVAVLNRMLAAARAKSARCKVRAAQLMAKGENSFSLFSMQQRHSRHIRGSRFAGRRVLRQEPDPR